MGVWRWQFIPPPKANFLAEEAHLQKQAYRHWPVAVSVGVGFVGDTEWVMRLFELAQMLGPQSQGEHGPGPRHQGKMVRFFSLLYG